MKQRLRIAWLLMAALTSGLGSRDFAWGQALPAASQHLVCGIVHKVNGAKFSLETRNGKTVQVDASAAIHAKRSAILYEGLTVSAEGTLDKNGALLAEIVNRIKSDRVMWPEDR